MKLYDGGLIVLIVIVSICVVGGVASTFFWGNDNPIEETAEEIIKEKTGMDVDLTPSTPETKK